MLPRNAITSHISFSLYLIAHYHYNKRMGNQQNLIEMLSLYTVFAPLLTYVFPDGALAGVGP